MAEAKASDFSVTLYPHRSLNWFGLRLVLGAVLLSNFIVAMFFWAYHAWPVFGFMGLDVLLVIAAFTLNNKAANRSEQIIFEGEEVTVIRSRAGMEAKRAFNRRWLRVELEYDADRELIGRLFLKSHGRKYEVASFLGAEERQALARRLQTALVRSKI